MILSRFVLPAFLFLIVSPASAQGFEVIFPGLAGEELLDSVARHYRPDTVLDYTDARDTLYARILALDDDSLRCIYSGHTLWLDPSQDPTQYVYQNGGTNGMNTEHAYPQAKGAAEGNARSDMHHIYPTRIAVNEARGNSPYTEIPDAQTQRWYINNQFFTSIPTSNINAYSEQRTDAFEPREAVKGDLARSVFYFYTMYRSQANAADPNYFELQRPTLCQWVQQDPPDSTELRKTWRIAPYQDGKPNPFVVDCTLATRCWCPGAAPACLSNSSAPETPVPALLVWPNPATEQMVVTADIPDTTIIRLLHLSGQTALQQELRNGRAEFSLRQLPRGMYVVTVAGFPVHQLVVVE